MQKYHSKHENIANQTQFRTWKKGKSWLYAASILTVLTGGAAASSVVTPDSVTASADTVTPAAYPPAGEATGPGSVVSSEVASNASNYYAAASSALSGTDSDGVHSSGASDIVSSSNDKAADANSYISSSTGSLSSGASSVASGTLDGWNNAASSFVSAASSNTTTNSLSSAVSNYQNALDSANSYNVANNIKTSGGANSEYAATYSDGSGNIYSSNAVSQYQSAVDSYSTAVHNYYNSAVATLDKNATLSGWYDTLTADKNILNAYDSDSAANTPAGALKSDSSVFATALSGLNSLVSASGASNFFSSAAASVAAAGSDVATYDYSSAYSLAVVGLQTTANQVLTQYQTDYGTYMTGAEQYAQDSNAVKAAGYNGTVTALTDSATQQINFETAWGNASKTIKDFTTSANTNGTLMNDNAQIMADYEAASLAYTDFSKAAAQQNADLVTLTDIVANFPMSASTSGETTATDTLTSWEAQYTAAIQALQSDVAKTEYYQGIYNDKLAAYNDDATDPLYPSDNPTLPTATGNTAADYLNKLQTGLGTIDAAQNGTVSADAAQVLTNYETHKLVTITFASSFVLSDRFYNNILTVSIPTHSTWAIAGLGPDYDNTAYTITTSLKGKTKQPTNTLHIRPVLPNTPPTVPPVAPPEAPNIREKPNLPNSPRIPQVPKVPNQPMIARKPTLSLTSSRLKIPEPLKYVPVGKILPHTGDNSDSSLTIYGGAALTGFIGLEIYSLKRRKKP
ncbi:KxYKxGKxW signal peptide domain-containing protein [Lactococcus lactis]|uniref:LPXTG cell wall anchor domain-containing protein n=1 Tax=Lactococcus lactis TaxID=1358 RepID=UPI002416E947|nr:KxYKxGKxW signal peptide domain-containing protein [Lactococcus lactis]MDG4954321.1 KxYKxGKxW signal peptide domain-containing protein [Lactococcus lactis]